MARENGTKLIADNRRARRDYELLERVEAGVVLSGTEVKSARDGKVQLGQSYGDIRDGEAWLVGASIAEYAQGGPFGHEPDRDRKLLLHRSEIDSLHGAGLLGENVLGSGRTLRLEIFTSPGPPARTLTPPNELSTSIVVPAGTGIASMHRAFAACRVPERS